MPGCRPLADPASVDMALLHGERAHEGTCTWPRPQKFWRHVGTVPAFFAGLALLALAIRPLARAGISTMPASVMEPMGALSVFGEQPLKQCGGEGYTGNTCCQTGCACIYRNPSYSECQPPIGMSNCNLEVAKLQLNWTTDNLGRVKNNVAETAKMSAIYEALALTAKEEWQKADQERTAAFNYGLVKRDAWQKGKGEKAAALETFKTATEAVEKAIDVNRTIALELADLETAAHDDGSKPPSCVSIWGTCNAGVQCCAGCMCKLKASNYWQCLAPGGLDTCSLESTRTKLQDKLAEAEKAKVAAQQAEIEKQRAVDAAHEVELKSAMSFKDAAAAGAAREMTVQTATRLLIAMELAGRQADKARELASKAYAAEEIAQAAAAAWEKAASGNAC